MSDDPKPPYASDAVTTAQLSNVLAEIGALRHVVGRLLALAGSFDPTVFDYMRQHAVGTGETVETPEFVGDVNARVKAIVAKAEAAAAG